MDVDSLEWHNEPVLQDLLEAKQARIDAEVAMIGAVRRARDFGLSWQAIGDILCTTGEAARQRYKAAVKA